MNIRFSLLGIYFLYAVQSLAQVQPGMVSYDQTIQIICNLSDVNSQRTERRSVAELLEQNVGGFRFHLLWDHENSHLLYRRPDGQLRDFSPVMDEISNGACSL